MTPPSDGPRKRLARDGAFVPALKELATAAIAKGELSEPRRRSKRSIALRQADANALADLGNVYLQQGRNDVALHNGCSGRSRSIRAFHGRTTRWRSRRLRKGVPEEAETYFREAIRQQPDLAEAHNNLGNLLAGRKEYAEAAHHFEKAIAIDPAYVAARHSYGVVLALMRVVSQSGGRAAKRSFGWRRSWRRRVSTSPTCWQRWGASMRRHVSSPSLRAATMRLYARLPSQACVRWAGRPVKRTACSGQRLRVIFEPHEKRRRVSAQGAVRTRTTSCSR